MLESYSRRDLTLVIQCIHELLLPSVHLRYCAEDVLRMLKNDLDAARVNELKVNCMYIEYTLCKVNRLLGADI
jgi:hypothetical protein